MDRLCQAEEILSTLGAGGGVIVAGRALSPMDCQRTIPVSRETIATCQLAADAPSTVVVDPEMERAARGIGSTRRAPRSA